MNAQRCEQISILFNSSLPTDFNPINVCPEYIQLGCAEEQSNVISHSTESSENAWVTFAYGFVAVTIINLSSIGGLMIVPLMNRRAYHRVLLFFIAMAVSALLSNALFHLIPQALELNEPTSQKYDQTMVIIFAGFYGFYVVGKLLDIGLIKCCSRGSSEREETLLNVHSHSHVSSRPSISYHHPDKEVEIVENGNNNRNNGGIRKEESRGLMDGLEKVKTIAWLLTLGDGMHNFLDGLAIGTAFMQSIDRGIIISVAIACEEFPHELGDFAVLLRSGMTTRQAVFFNFLSAFFCYLGLILGTCIGQEPEAARVIIAITAGVFLYISLAGMLPEMEDAMKSEELGLSSFQAFLISSAGLLVGACILKTLSLMLPQ